MQEAECSLDVHFHSVLYIHYQRDQDVHTRRSLSSRKHAAMSLCCGRTSGQVHLGTTSRALQGRTTDNTKERAGHDSYGNGDCLSTRLVLGHNDRYWICWEGRNS